MQREAKEFTTNLQSSLVSFMTHDNKDYMVAPCIALVPGVLNGELVTLEAVSNTYQGWNGRPVVIDHPYALNGTSISANSPDILAHSGIGHIWNADIENKKLRVQVWIDIEKANRLGGDAVKVLETVKSGMPLEVSTGYWAVTKEKNGTHNNLDYSSVTELIIPDHLAMLPNAVGACSWGDGCGIPRTMKASKMDEATIIATIKNTLKSLIPGFTQNMTATDKFQALSTLISQEMETEGIDSWRWHMVDIEDNYVIIGIDNMFKRRPFLDMDNGNVQLSGEWEVTYQQTTFVPVANQGGCSCGGVKVQAEEDEPAPTPPMPSPEPVPEETAPEPEHEVPETEVPETEESPEEPEEESEVTVDTLQAFLDEHGVTEDELLVTVQARANWRKAMVAVIKANSNLRDADFDGVVDAVLETMAATYQAEPVERTPGQRVSAGIYALRGAPVSQPAELQTKKLARRKPLLDKVS